MSSKTSNVLLQEGSNDFTKSCTYGERGGRLLKRERKKVIKLGKNETEIEEIGDTSHSQVGEGKP